MFGYLFLPYTVFGLVGPSSGDGEAVWHQERRGANPLWIRMPMQKSENSRFVDEVCCSTMDLDRETAMAVSVYAEMRDMYASRTTGT